MSLDTASTSARFEQGGATEAVMVAAGLVIQR
jgi:hypothetical protein